MQTALLALKSHVDVLSSAVLAPSGKKGRTKTERYKAVVAIHEMLSKKNVRIALTAATAFEMVRGPPDDDSSGSTHLGWVGLTTVLLETLREACDDALSSKATAKSGQANIKPDYMKCFKRAIRLAMQDAPGGVICPVVPAFLVFAHEYLGEPAIRRVLANDIWQCVRDVLHDDANRAMLTPPFMRTWIDDCFQQLTGRGPMKHASEVATSLAGELFQIMATPVDSYDVLTQSSRGISPSKMMGGDFGYAMICERCCLMLVVADSLSRRHGRELQKICFRTLTIALSDHALDVCDSSALNSIINVSLNPLLSCWIERKCHDAAVSLARNLLLIAPNNKKLSDAIRNRIRSDISDISSSAVVRAGKDVKNDYIDVAASCFSFREALEFAISPDALEGHIIIWLRAAASIMSARVLKRETTVLVDPRDVFDQCLRAAEAVSQILTTQNKSRGNSFTEIVNWSCEVVNITATTANRIFIIDFGAKPSDTTAWCNLYRTLRELLTSYFYSGRTLGHSRIAEDSNPDECLLQTVTLLSSFHLVNHATLESPTRTGPGQLLEMPFPMSRLLSSTKLPLRYDVELLQNIIARNGFTDEDGTGLRYRLVQALLSLLYDSDNWTSSSSDLLINASASVLGLVHGECGISNNAESAPRSSRSLSDTALLREKLFFGLAIGSKEITSNGDILVKRMRDQDLVWKSYLQPDSAQSEYEIVQSVFDPDSRMERSLPSLSRHFAISGSLVDKLELEILSHMVDGFKTITKIPNQPMNDPDTGVEDYDEIRFLDPVSTHKGVRILIFASNYLVQGLRLGLISTAEITNQERSASDQLISLVVRLFFCLNNVDFSVMSGLPDLAKVCITLCCDLTEVLQDEGNREKWKNDSPWKLACKALPIALTRLSSKLCEHFMAKLLDLTKVNRKKIMIYAEDRLEDPTVHQDPATLKRSRRGERESPSRKRRRFFSSSEGSQSSDDHGFPGDNDNDPMQNEVEIPGSDSDDFGDANLNLSRAQRPVVKKVFQKTKVSSELPVISELLEILASKMRSASETILDRCTNGLAALTDVERMLSPDGFERAALFSSLIDPHSVQVRQHIWDVLFSVDNASALVAVGSDILKIGRYWKALENISQSYVMFHVDPDACKRKHYPLPNHLEESRIIFLDSARKFLEKVQIHWSSRSMELVSQEAHGIVKGLVDISEHFRIQHAFRMPRRTRLAYLKFGSAAISLQNELALSHHAMDDPQGNIDEKLGNIRGALCKLFGDSEAMVRFVAARVVAKVFSSWATFTLTEVEKTFEENLPSTEMCTDSEVIFGANSDLLCDIEMTDTVNQWNLTDDEVQAKSVLQKSFQKVGSKSKGLSILATLGEISAAREDLLPFLFIQLGCRESQGMGLTVCGYSVIARICIVLGLRSPRSLYQVFSRAILPRLLGSPRSVYSMYSYPAALFLDEHHHRDGAVFDWLREEQSDILPHILVQERTNSFELTSQFAKNMSTSVGEMLEQNVCAFAVVFPMQFIPGLHDRGQKLWSAIDSFLNGKTVSLMSKKKDEVVSSLLLSTSGNFVCRYATQNRGFDIIQERGFSRDTQSLRPPFYDPLIVASAINHLHGSSSDTSIVPKNVMRGSLFAELRDEQNGNLVVRSFPAFVKECRRSNNSLMRCLLTVSKALDPSLTCQSFHNHLDAYFCVGLLWMMLDSHILVKPANERLMFYKLLARGFEYVETSCDAAWLLMDVQMKLLSVNDLQKNFEVFDSDLSLRPENREHLTDLKRTEERQMYELLSTVSPILISIITDQASSCKNQIRESAYEALTRLLSFCASKKLWRVIVCNGPFPGGKHFKEAQSIYEKASTHAEGGLKQDVIAKIFSSLKRFSGIYRQRDKSHSIVSSLAFLQEIRLLLSDPNVLELSNCLSSEAWFRANGEKLPSASIIGSSIAALVNLLRDISHDTRKGVFLTRRGRLTDQVLRVVADVINTLGLVHQYSWTFIHTDTYHRSIPAKQITGNYEVVEDGIFQSILWLVDILRSGSSIVSEAAMRSLTAVLHSTDGKILSGSKRDELHSIIPIRGGDRKDSIVPISTASNIAYDPRNGDVVFLDNLPQYDEARLWDLSAFISQEEGNHQGWMRRVCAVLSCNCKSSANRALAVACFASFRLCCDVFPYLLMDIVSELNVARKSKLSSLISKYVLSNPQTPSKILRIFVYALDVLCQIGLSVTCLSGVGAWLMKTQTGKLSIPYLYLLDIPYSEVVLVALKCGASFSAIRYSHLFIDHKKMEMEANLREGDSDSLSKRRPSLHVGKDLSIEEIERAALNKAKPWIRRAMMQISDMDGIRAFAPTNDLAEAAVSMSSLDEEWFRSLANLGVASRADSFPGNSFISGDPNIIVPETRGVDLRLELDTFRSLLGIGNLRVATHYWDGLLNQISRDGLKDLNDPSYDRDKLIRKMNDLRYSAAWKLEHWESPTLISTRTTTGVSTGANFSGFHHAVYRVLHLIKTDRLAEIPHVLNSARHQVLNDLCYDNWGVSAQKILETSAQLRVFQVLDVVKPNEIRGVPAPVSESADWSLGCTPQRTKNSLISLVPDDSNIASPTIYMNDLFKDLNLVLGGYYGTDDFESRGVLPSRDAFSGPILAEDLPVIFIRCLGQFDRVAQAAATASARIFFKANSGSWARSASCLGTPTSSFLNYAPRTDQIAWKLQECRLRWTASDDARSRKRALTEIKDTIFSQLGGKMHERTNAGSSSSSSGTDGYGLQQSLSWEESESGIERLGFLRSEACRLAANWSLDMKTHEPMDLFQTYLEPGLKATEVAGVEQLAGHSHFAMASFADAQISNIDAYRRSRKYEQMVSSVKETEEHIERLNEMKRQRTSKAKQFSRRRSRLSSEASVVSDKVGKDLDYFILISRKQARQDRVRLEKLNDTYKKWQVLACGHFAACLRNGTTHNLRAAFRMVALWLDAGDMRDAITCALTGENDSTASGVPVRVPVGKLLPLAPQLFSRLNFSENTVFQKTLASTITNMAGYYPAYCLWQLLALTNATRTSGNEERMSSLYRGDKDKKSAADDIFRRLESKHGTTVREMKQVADAYIALSESPVQKGTDGSTIDIARTSLLRLGELRHVSVPTVSLPMHVSDVYCDTLPYIEGFEKGARVCAGLSKPLKIKCIGSDGNIYPQILKGRDDLRGDAVMEQMFTILNSLLESDREASRRNLYIRTYRIIPLSPFTGIMQFVKNTVQFKELLVEKNRDKSGRAQATGKGSLHERYRPRDMKHATILAKAFKDHENYKNNVAKRLVLMRVVWKNFQPVFRYFFVEQWPDAAEWFAHQLNYSRSMAVMSIVGFILGLGDRHLSNILVDVDTAEVVHIDFGVAFEQGKLLPTPEHMPFRLTRDLVDGFGVAGVEGVFRRCCEITLSIMRRHKDVLLTVVQVLLHDPMFNWALTPEDVLREQLNPDGDGHNNDLSEDLSSSSPGDSSIDAVALKLKRDISGSREAHRALNRISEKLDGLEGTERLSVEAHVARLLDEAQAFHVIASVFPGWSPWL